MVENGRQKICRNEKFLTSFVAMMFVYCFERAANLNLMGIYSSVTCMTNFTVEKLFTQINGAISQLYESLVDLIR